MLVIKAAALSPPDTNRTRWVESRLQKAFSTGVSPVPVPEAKLVRFTVGLTDTTATQLKQGATAAGVSLAMYCAQLLAALDQDVAATPIQVNTPLMGADLVSPQLLGLLQACWHGVEQGRVVFAEAATGTGKGRMIASLALTAAAAEQTVLIAAPLNVTRQLIDDLHLLDPETMPCLLLGRANFVDPDKVELWLASQEQDAENGLRTWLASGGLPASQATQQLAEKVAIPLRWLAEDAVTVASDDAPVTSWLLDEDTADGNDAQLIYLASQELARTTAKIVVCSHMMLAADSRHRDLKRPGLLPDIDMLLVDEAHLLEQAFASIHSQTMALRPLENAIRHSSVPARQQRELISAIHALGEAIHSQINTFGNEGYAANVVTDTLAQLPQIRFPCERIAQAVESIDLGQKKIDDATRRTLRYLSATVADVLSERSTIQLSLSPIRQYPSLTVGRANLEGVFDRFWDRVPAAVLASATLYLPDTLGQHSAGHLRWVLSVPKTRALYYPPVVPDWVIEAVDLVERYEGLIPDDSEEWIKQIAELVLEADASAAGGILVLLTSYRTAEALYSALQACLGERLVVQTASNSAAACAAQFREQYKAGKRAVWLGLGTSAWTGVSLGDPSKAPADDFMLTDLVIPRLPFGCNRTLTHDRRRRQLGLMCEAHEALRMFRQGLGRLVRREGVLRRRLWVSDARLHPGSRKGFVSGFKLQLAKYKRRS